MKNCILLTGLLFLASSAAADIKNGQTLHDGNCMKCHDDGMYKREDRFIKDIQGLRTQVQRCELNLGLQWFDEQIDDVTNYLNQTYYKFK